MSIESRVPIGTRFIRRAGLALGASALLYGALKRPGKETRNEPRGGWSYVDFEDKSHEYHENTMATMGILYNSVREEIPLDFAGLRGILEVLHLAVADYTKELHYDDPTQLLFTGVNSQNGKLAGGEHDLGDGRQSYFMGEYGSLLHPELLSDDPDLQSEHWMVNPLNYALTGGTLVVYDRAKICSAPDQEYDSDFGTVMVNTTPDFIKHAEVGRLGLFQED